jgi:hypothetical protein
MARPDYAAEQMPPDEGCSCLQPGVACELESVLAVPATLDYRQLAAVFVRPSARSPEPARRAYYRVLRQIGGPASCIMRAKLVSADDGQSPPAAQYTQ